MAVLDLLAAGASALGGAKAAKAKDAADRAAIHANFRKTSSALGDRSRTFQLYRPAGTGGSREALILQLYDLSEIFAGK